MNTENNSTGGAARMEERLWSYIDGQLDAEEHSVIERLIAADAEWRSKYQELVAVNEVLQASELEAPSLRFTKNVMDEISRLHIAPAAKSYINKRIIWGIGFFFIALLVSFLVYGFSQMDFSGGAEGTISRELGKFDISKFFNNTWVNVFMMVNIVLGLVLLDQYLNRKRKIFQKES